MPSRLLSFLICSVLLLPAAVFSQTGTPSTDDKDVVKISTTLIQVDATVTDKKGNIVKDLKPEDFEVYENSKKQDITNFSFILPLPENQPVETNNALKPSNKSVVSLPSARLKPEAVKRTFTLVVDDLGLSFAGVFWVKDALKRFVNEQMQEGDLVAIIRVSGGIGALQSFTSDKRQLLAAIDKIHWNGQGRIGVNSYEPIEQSLEQNIDGNVRKGAQGTTVTKVAGMEENRQSQMQAESNRQSNFAVGTVGALTYVIRGMRDLPGRKSLLLFSEGFQIFDYSKSAVGNNNVSGLTRIIDELRSLADLANRSSVVIYTLDPRGLTVPADLPEAIDDTPSGPSKNVDLQIRGSQIKDSQDSLRYLARETGGVAFVEQNDMNDGIKKALNDQKGYYLIGYQPDSETFEPNKNKFNTLTIKLKRPDLKIRYRSGFFGITDDNYKQTSSLSPKQKLLSALVSPFGTNDINLSLYSFFYNDFRNRDFIRSFVYIDPKDLSFSLDHDGFYRAKIEIIASVFDTNGASANNGVTATTLQFSREKFLKVQKEGIIYNLVVPIVKTGAYQFRVALQDSATGKIGSASQFIEIPNLAKKNLTLSNLIVKNYSLEEWKTLTNQAGSSPSPDNNFYLDTALRQFKLGTKLNYTCLVYNARTDSAQKPNLQTQTRLFHNGKMILESEPAAVNTSAQSDSERIDISNIITLGTDLEPGDYVLQLIVTDNLAKEKNQMAAQSIDFELVK